ncbi:MAG: hypothetical protein ACSNEK_05875 [Parachlamydiaceae bacterium]
MFLHANLIRNPFECPVEEIVSFLKYQHLEFLESIFSFFDSGDQAHGGQISFQELLCAVGGEQKKEKGQLLHFRHSSTLNKEIWRYLELIEGNIVELFVQLEMIDINLWNESLCESLSFITIELRTYLDELLILIRSLEHCLSEQKVLYYTKKMPFHWLIRSLLRQSHSIDPQIKLNIENSKSYLDTQFCSLHKKMNRVIGEKYKIAKEAKSLKSLIGLYQLDKREREYFLQFYRSLMLRSFAIQEKIISKNDFWKYFDFTYSPTKLIELFSKYYEVLLRTFYRLCHDWRETHHQKIVEDIESLGKEKIHLEGVLRKYRSLLLVLNPNPYVSTKLGFSESVVGPEPTYSLQLKELLFALTSLNKLIGRFSDSIVLNKFEDADSKLKRVKTAIELLSHQMGQPLISRKQMVNLMERMVTLLEELDELGGSVGDVSEIITTALLTLLNYDWYHQILQGNEKFKEVYDIHLQVEKKAQNLAHEHRLVKMEDSLFRLKSLLGFQDPFKVINDAESDLTEINALLQELFYSTKRLWENTNEADKFTLAGRLKLEVLEYYQLFSSFLVPLNKEEPNGKLLLNSFFSVKQYLDATLQVINSKSIQCQ